MNNATKRAMINSAPMYDQKNNTSCYGPISFLYRTNSLSSGNHCALQLGGGFASGPATEVKGDISTLFSASEPRRLSPAPESRRWDDPACGSWRFFKMPLRLPFSRAGRKRPGLMSSSSASVSPRLFLCSC